MIRFARVDAPMPRAEKRASDHPKTLIGPLASVARSDPEWNTNPGCQAGRRLLKGQSLGHLAGVKQPVKSVEGSVRISCQGTEGSHSPKFGRVVHHNRYSTMDGAIQFFKRFTRIIDIRHTDLATATNV
jgi:hypothetical protein